MVSAPSAQQIALACGVSGAYVEVTDDLVTDSISGTWGRTTAFSDTRPGVFAFDLVNDDGKYTPGNASSSLSTAVRVGMGVSHIVDGMHFSGTIRSAQPYFTGPASLSGSSKVRVTSDDMLGEAARTTLSGSTAFSMVLGSQAHLFWPFNETASAAQATEQSGNLQLPIVAAVGPSGLRMAFGATGFAALGADTQLQVTTELTQQIFATPSYLGSVSVPGQLETIDYPVGSMGTWGAWFTPVSGPSQLEVLIRPNGYNTALSPSIRFGINTSQQFQMRMGAASAVVSAEPLVYGVPRYLQLVVTNSGSTSITGELFIDGVSQGTSDYVPGGGDPAGLSTNYLRTPMWVALISPSAVGGVTNIAHLSHTPVPVAEYLAVSATEAGILTALDQAAVGITLDTLPTNLSTSPISAPSRSNSVLDALNEVIRAEQGYIWTETTGTLTSPVQKITIRARDREDAVDAAHTFNVTQILNAPEFTTEIENMVSATTARGPLSSATVADPALIPYVGSASDSANLLFTNRVDLIAWAQDRLLRGTNFGVRLPQFTVDALAINRWADICALRAGDRVRIDGLPLQQLGVDHIDGWLLGSSYSLRYPALHGEDQMLFTFSLQPVLPRTAIYDTDSYMSDGALTLSVGINSSVTTMSVATTGPKLETVAVPYDLLLDSEQVTVTNVTSATPQVATMVRGVNGTMAAAHTTSAIIEVADDALYAF